MSLYILEKKISSGISCACLGLDWVQGKAAWRSKGKGGSTASPVLALESRGWAKCILRNQNLEKRTI